MLKSEVRAVYLSKRKLLTDSELSGLETAINRQFSQLSFVSLRVLLSYQPIHRQKEFTPVEPETQLRQQFPAIQVCYPHVVESFRMVARPVTSQTEWTTNIWGIAEPFSTEEADPKTIDIIFVPLIAVTMQGFRIGYGKGFYDRYMMQCRPDVLKVGFSFFEPIPAVNDISQFDVPLNYCITPTKIYEF